LQRRLIAPTGDTTDAAEASGAATAGLNFHRRAEALAAAHLIAERVTDPDTISAAVARARQQTRYPASVHWTPAAVVQGDAGQALLAAHLAAAFPDEGWADVARGFLGRAVTYARGHGVPVGAAAGLSGVAYTLAVVDGDDRSSSVRHELDRLISQGSLAVIAELHGARREGRVTPSMFDVISGLSGVALYLLPRADGGPAGAALPFVLRALCDLALGEVTPDGRQAGPLPAWYTPAQLLYDDEQRRLYPSGNLNCGLAHGLPGLVAALALATKAGHGSDRVSEAVAATAGWLARNYGEADDGPRWPTAIATEAYGRPEGTDPRTTPSRDAWCYGNPGVARSLYLAGVALDRAEWRELATAGMMAIYRRPIERRGIDSPTFCHGVSGLLQITQHFARDTGLPLFAEAAASLLDQVLAAIDEDLLLGVANLEPGGVRVDQPGLLDGATGVCLTLLSAAEAPQPAAAWDRLFALS
jgi:lantibiotic biosynthesis protein